MASINKLSQLAAVTIVAGGTAQKLFGTGPYKQIVSISIRAPSGNTASVYAGDASVLASTFLGLEVPKGTTQTISGDNGSLLNVENIYIDGTTNDKVYVSYLEKL